MISWNRTRFATFALAVTLCPGAALAQVPDRSFGELQRILKAGDTVVVTDDTGTVAKGKVMDLSSSSLTLGDDDAVGPTFSADRTTHVSVRRKDSLADGMLIGFGAGAVAAWGFVRGSCGPAGYDDECAAIVALGAYPIGVGVGVAVGAVIDAAIRKTITVPLRPDSRVTLSPVLGADRQGAQLSVRF